VRAIKQFFLVVSVCSIVLSATSYAQAANVVGDVLYVGQVVLNGSPFSVLYVKDANGNVASYGFPTVGSNSMTAIALTAMSNSKTVTATVDDNNYLTALYINGQ
jgi:hypothetical protein